jgi:hypothetical protein
MALIEDRPERIKKPKTNISFSLVDDRPKADQKLYSGEETNPEPYMRADTYTNAAKSFAKGVGRGSLLGKALPDSVKEDPFQNSVFNAQGDVKTGLESAADNVGEFAGATVDFVIADMLAGLAMPALIAKHGLGLVSQAMHRGAIGFGGMQGVKAVAEGGNAVDVLKETGKGMAIGAGIGAIGGGLSAGREFLGKTVPEGLENSFLHTSKRTATNLAHEGKDSLGLQALKHEPELTGLKTREAVYNKAGVLLQQTENEVNAGLARATAQGKAVDPRNLLDQLDETIRAYDKPGIFGDRITELKNIRQDFLTKHNATDEARRKFMANQDPLMPASPPTINITELNDLRRVLDKFVGKTHESIDPKMAPLVEASEALANAARREVAEYAPDVAKYLAREHRLLNIRNSLEGTPQVAKTGYLRGNDDFFKTTAKAALSNSGSPGMAKALYKTLEEPNLVRKASDAAVQFGARPGVRVGLSEMISDVRDRGKRKPK